MLRYVAVLLPVQLISAHPSDFRTGSGARNAPADLVSLSIVASIDSKPQYATSPILSFKINDSVNTNSAASPDLIHLGISLPSYMHSPEALLLRSDHIRVEGKSTATIKSKATPTETDIASSDRIRGDSNSSSQFSGSLTSFTTSVFNSSFMIQVHTLVQMSVALPRYFIQLYKYVHTMHFIHAVQSDFATDDLNLTDPSTQSDFAASALV